MNNKDFQNGFAIGFASGGVNSSPLTEEVLAEFKEKEIDYIKSYTYNLAEFEGKTTSSNKKIINLEVYATPTNDGGGNNYCVCTACSMHLFERVGDNPVKPLADSPLKPIINNGRLEGVSNLKDIIDVEFIFIDGSTMSFNRTIKSIVDGEIFFKGVFGYNGDSSQTEARDTYRIDFIMALYTESQEIANSMVADLGAVIENGYIKDVVLYYQNQPEIENVDTHYLGGE